MVQTSLVGVTMLNKINISNGRQKLIIYVVLATVTLAVYWQVSQFDFITLDDHIYVTLNRHIQSGITLDGFRWAFVTTYAEFWHPLTWLSLMFDYHVHGLNAGGYHLTNLILHILSTLLLFWLFNRMTGAIWKSAFVAALFAFHPLHVESVAWVSERKDVLSGFFCMLTLCLYVYYTEKPAIKRYLLVLFSFAGALMSKPIVVTLPFVLLLLDYWPLKRFESKKGNLILFQFREKMPFFVFSAVFSIITFYAKPSVPVKRFPLSFRLANAPVSFVTYLEKTFWPLDLAVFYPFPFQIQIWKVVFASLLILIISTAVIVAVKHLPYLFVGWLWYAIILLPVIGIIQVGNHAMADRYTYLPSVGIAVMLAWGMPLLFPREDIRKKFLFPAGISFLAIMALLAWQQCGYWKNSFKLFSHALSVTKNNYLAHNSIASALSNEGKNKEAIYHYNHSISIEPNYILTYINKGVIYTKLGQYQLAIENFNEAIRRNPDNAEAYYKRGLTYDKLGQYQRAIEDYNKAIRLKPDNDDVYIDRGIIYTKLGQYQLAIENFNEAISRNPSYVEVYHKRGYAHAKFGQYQQAIEDYNKAIRLNPNYADAYIERGVTYGERGQYQLAIKDFDEAIRLNSDNAEAHNNRGFTYFKFGQNQRAIDDYNEAIRLNPNYINAYNNRGIIYINQGNKNLGCRDAQKACALGSCELLEIAKGKGYCR